jgi:hypothetical protein
MSGNDFIKVVPVFILLISGCNIKDKSKNQLPKVDIAEAWEKNKEVKLSEIIENEIEYVRLETKKENILGDFIRIYTTDSQIIAISFRHIFLFNRKTGEFIREIGHYGKDPEGYRNTIFSFPFDEENTFFYAHGWLLQQYLCYDQTGRQIKKINAPLNTHAIGPLNKKINVAYIKNYQGNEVGRLVLFSDRDTMIKIFPNYNRFTKEPSVTLYRNHGWFYRFNSNLLFFEQFTDTIFKVNSDNLFPLYKLEMGKYLPPYVSQQKNNFIHNEMKKFFFVENIFESNRFLIFTIGFRNSFFQGVYDKKRKETQVSKGENGFENDVNGFLPFHYFSINSKGELVGFLEAYKVKQWFSENPEKVAKLPSQLQKLLNLKETDNPVVMIAKLEE